MDTKIEIQILGGALLVSSLATWLWIATRLAAGKALVRYEPREEVPWNGFDVLAVFGFYLVAQQIAIGAAVQFVGLDGKAKDLLSSADGRMALFAGVLFCGAASFVFAIALAVARYRASAADFGFVWRRIGYDIRVGVLTFLAFGPLVYLINAALVYFTGIQYEHDLLKVFDDRANFLTLSLGVAVAVIAAPIVEELLLRVYLQGWLEKLEVRWTYGSRQFASRPRSVETEEPVAESVSDISAQACVEASSFDKQIDPGTTPPLGVGGVRLGSLPIWASSIVFALLHLGQGPAHVPLFVFALALGFVYQRTHRAMPSIVAHFALNATSMAMLLLQPLPPQ